MLEHVEIHPKMNSQCHNFSARDLCRTCSLDFGNNLMQGHTSFLMF
jgi:hypothetical protein